jgi:hypothetical protein
MMAPRAVDVFPLPSPVNISTRPLVEVVADKVSADSLATPLQFNKKPDTESNEIYIMILIFRECCHSKIDIPGSNGIIIWLSHLFTIALYFDSGGKLCAGATWAKSCSLT